MDEEIYAILQKIQRGNDRDVDSEEDYGNFLANLMHARNRGAEDDEIERLLNAHSPDRIEGMADNLGGTNFERDPYIAQDRSSLNAMLRKRMGK